MSKSDEPLVRSVVQSLDDSCENLDADTQDTLAQMRRAALDQIPSEKPSSKTPAIWALGGSCAAAVLAVFIFFSSPSDQAVEPFEDIDVLLAGEDFDMLQEQDLEFLLWLEAQDALSSAEES